MKKRILIICLILLINVFFVDIISAETYNNYTQGTVSCGLDYDTNEFLISGIPTALPKVISLAYTIIQIAVPVILVVLGTLDLFKGITASKEEDLKKGQKMFIKRLISAVLVFFVFVAVKFIVSFVADGNSSRIMNCAECFIKNQCDS